MIYKNIICFFSFLFITRNIRMGWVRESWRRLRCAHRDWYWATSRHLIIQVSPCSSTFVSLVKGYLKASNPFRFSSIFYFRESGTAQAFLYLSALVVWRKASAQSSVTSTSSSVGLLPSPLVFLGLYNFRLAHANPSV